MKPDFALSLSLQGVRLFHRAADGWDEVGTVPVDSPDLAGEIAALRARGLALAGDAGTRLACKIVIPNDLVRYLAIDDPRIPEDGVMAALEGMTPYTLAELVQDHRPGGGRMHVAAVARENLDEAETFAVEHGFAPLAFVATPEPWTFPGEVNFGPTRMAAAILPAGETVETDTEGVPVGPPPAAAAPDDAAGAEGQADEDSTPATGADPATDDPAVVPGAADDQPPETAEAPEPPPAPEPPDAAAPPAPVPDADPADIDAEAEEAPFIAVDENGDPEPDPAATADAPLPVFASRSRPQGITPAAPPLVLAQTDAVPPAAVAEPVFTSRALRADPRTPGPASRREPSLKAATPQAGGADAPKITAVPPPPPPEPAAAIIPLAAARPGAVPRMPGQSAARDAESEAAPAPKPRRRIGLGLMLTLLLLILLALVALWSTTLEGGLAALFDREAAPRTAGALTDTAPATPIAAAGEAAPVATSGLEPAGAGPEAASLAPDAIATPEAGADPATLPPPDAAAPATAAPGLAAPEADGADALPATAPEPDGGALVTRAGARAADGPDNGAALAAVAGAALLGTLVTPEEADRVYQSTGVWLRAPRLPLVPHGETLDDLVLAAADPARADATPVALTDQPGLAPDPGLPAQPVPPPAGTTISRDARGLISATPEGVLLPTGITVFAGAPPRVPPTRPGTEPPPVAVADVIESSGIRPTARPASVLDAAISAGMAEAPVPDDGAGETGTAEADARTPAPDGAVPEGEPEGEAASPDDSATVEPLPGGVALALVAPERRPAARPASVVPPPAWEGKKPPNRPARFAALAAPEAAAAEPPADPLAATLEAITAAPDPLAGVTARAVPQAQRPGARPRNFDRVVQTQTEILARASAATQAAAAAPEPAQVAAASAPAGNLTQEEAAEASAEVSSIAAPAAGPTPGGVAQAATVARAINLREVNLIGVFGPQSSRRALVRLANGRLVRVGVGDSLDGGQVVAIGDGFLNYAKRGQTYSLRVPG
ncbi:MAG: hypothetical protein H3C51_00915 [Rubellimicrobium sp.]|nr:hypothetical protein [Rubellimicrobium sp.]